MTQVFNIDISDGSTALALPKAIQRDPIKDTFEHVDLLIVRRGEMITVDIPVHIVGDAARDTLVMVESASLSVLADATRLPDHVEASSPWSKSAQREAPLGSKTRASRMLSS